MELYGNLVCFSSQYVENLFDSSFDDEYESEGIGPGYISYKINTCAKPGNRDLSAYAGCSSFTSQFVYTHV